MSESSAEAQLTPPDPRPFVKWAGGKGSLLGEIAERIPRDREYRRYVEPFVGAGAMFFWVRRSFPGLASAIADRNEELIGAYRAVRDHVYEVVAKLETHAALHGEEHYYAVRARVPHAAVERAARFIYLNRTCFNGLYRVNRRGEFNVPIGRYRNPKIVDRENLLAVSSVLEGVSIAQGDFGELVEDCDEGDLVYLDPPYDPLSETSSFTSYTAGGFGPDDQERLAAAFDRMALSGATVILSNSDTPRVRDLYQSLESRPDVDHVTVARSINSRGGGRGRVSELLIHANAR